MPCIQEPRLSTTWRQLTPAERASTLPGIASNEQSKTGTGELKNTSQATHRVSRFPRGEQSVSNRPRDQWHKTPPGSHVPPVSEKKTTNPTTPILSLPRFSACCLDAQTHVRIPNENAPSRSGVLVMRLDLSLCCFRLGPPSSRNCGLHPERLIKATTGFVRVTQCDWVTQRPRP